MILFYAAAESALKELSAIDASNLLISMANGEKKIPKVPEFFDDYKLIIDSGAFTYANKGGITIEKWLSKAVALQQYGSELISLDVIGNAEKTFDNFNIISAEIENTIPTFHVGSDLKYLFKYLDKTDRIAIGGMVPYKSEIETLKKHLNKIFKNFTPETLPKFHAFGYFSQTILETYPFYSADASTWQNYSRFGEFHRFMNLKYTRMKSLRVGKLDLRKTSLDDLHTYIKDDPLDKLMKIKKALDEFEAYLTNLWKKRGINWNDTITKR